MKEERKEIILETEQKWQAVGRNPNKISDQEFILTFLKSLHTTKEKANSYHMQTWVFGKNQKQKSKQSQRIKVLKAFRKKI